MIHKKLCRILGIALEPVARISEAKTVAPGIHIQHKPVSPDPVNVIGQDKLQITNSGFLQIIATGIAIKAHTSILGHANNVTGFVK